jgi:hypothetical protein
MNPLDQPTRPTEAHYQLAHIIRQSSTQERAAQLIADSEARAIATQLEVVVILTRRWLNVEKERDQLRADCENETKWAAHYLAESIAVKGERDHLQAQLRALTLICGTNDANKFETWIDRANARAERAEAELAAERERSERYRLVTLHRDAELAAERARAPGPRLAPQSPTKMRPN